MTQMPKQSNHQNTVTNTHLTGSLNHPLPTLSTLFPKVAESNNVCRSGRIFSKILETCFSNPISNILIHRCYFGKI